jgi:metal-responsive CopG/Arc/MetJ family transcriptional regulator
MQEQLSQKKVDQDVPKPRVSVTFPADQYAAIEKIAKEKRVSIAWVVREAVRRYLEPEPNLFRRGGS